jgi:hypothetical protein
MGIDDLVWERAPLSWYGAPRRIGARRYLADPTSRRLKRRFVGRAVAALAADPQIASKTGKAFGSWTLAREYGFTDVDGRRPDWHGHVRRSMEVVLLRGGPADAGEMRRLGAWVRIEMQEDADWSRLRARAPAALAASFNLKLRLVSGGRDNSHVPSLCPSSGLGRRTGLTP